MGETTSVRGRSLAPPRLWPSLPGLHPGHRGRLGRWRYLRRSRAFLPDLVRGISLSMGLGGRGALNAGRRFDQVQKLSANGRARCCQIHRREPEGIPLYHRRFVEAPAGGRMQEQALGSIRDPISPPGLGTEIGINLIEMVVAEALVPVPAVRQNRGELRVDDDSAIRSTMLQNDIIPSTCAESIPACAGCRRLVAGAPPRPEDSPVGHMRWPREAGRVLQA